MYLPDEYISFLNRSGIDLKNPGLWDRALKRSDALHAIAILRNAAIPVSGGDVYIRSDDHIEVSYDSWSVERESQPEVSWNLAENYIKNYPDLGNGEPLFVLVPKVTARL